MRKIILFSVLISLLGCGKDVDINEVIKSFTVDNETIDADGSSVTLTAVLNPDASEDRRDVIFSTSGGSLVGAGADGTLKVKADFVNRDLKAIATLKGPMSAGKIIVTVAPATTSPNGDYSRQETITANTVLPESVDLHASSLGIGSSASSQDTIVATFRSGNNGKVSMGAEVQFEDIFPGGVRVGGHFTTIRASSNASSQASTIYAAPLLGVGTTIGIVGSIIDPVRSINGKADTIWLTINN